MSETYRGQCKRCRKSPRNAYGCTFPGTPGMPSGSSRAGWLCSSTTGIMEFAKKSEHKEFIIGTENSIVEHLQFECPDKKFYPVAVQLTCMNMKVTTLMDIYNCLKGQGGEEILLPENIMEGAGRCIHRMVELGGWIIIWNFLLAIMSWNWYNKSNVTENSNKVTALQSDILVSVNRTTDCWTVTDKTASGVENWKHNRQTLNQEILNRCIFSMERKHIWNNSINRIW